MTPLQKLCAGILAFLALSCASASALGGGPESAASQPATIPMTLDYDLLNSLVSQAFFQEEGQRSVLLEDQEGCRHIVVSAPRFFQKNLHLYQEIGLHLRYGLGLGDACLFPMTFDGFLVMQKRPALDTENMSLRFVTESSEMLNSRRKPARLASLAWSMIEEYVFPHQESIRVDLGPPIKELREFLPVFLPREQPELVLEMLSGMRPERVAVIETGLRLENTILVPHEIYTPQEQPEAPLSAEELEGFTLAWEAWDAFMVNMITSLADRELTAEERLLLLDVLLRMRYGFLDELEKPVPGRNLVRMQFVETWESLGPLFRARLLSSDSGSVLGYLAFFSASDALVALDRLGPALGLDISRDGLLRLARLLAQDRDTTLDYGQEVLPDLLRTLGLEERSALGESLRSAPALPWVLSLLGRIFAAPARAETLSADAPLGPDDPWIFRRGDVYGYLERIFKLLREQAELTLNESAMEQSRRELFEDMALATAWQESCFRQFLATGEQVTFLRSYNNTSVGLMQINERVWRGIYDQHKLRWDIAYNARAGTKILDLYLTRYAEPKMRREPGLAWTPDTVAGLLYAMYNGGPGQRDRFMQRLSEDKLYRSDNLFREKWNWVRQGTLDKASICLIGH